MKSVIFVKRQKRQTFFNKYASSLFSKEQNEKKWKGTFKTISKWLKLVLVIYKSYQVLHWTYNHTKTWVWRSMNVEKLVFNTSFELHENEEF